jgi:hypothetical protein
MGPWCAAAAKRGPSFTPLLGGGMAREISTRGSTRYSDGRCGSSRAARPPRSHAAAYHRAAIAAKQEAGANADAILIDAHGMPIAQYAWVWVIPQMNLLRVKCAGDVMKQK